MIFTEPIYIDAFWLTIAFILGLASKRIGLPPLVGFLAAGFIISFFDLSHGLLGGSIKVMSEIGVMLLLFTIGLKLKLKFLFKREIWQVGSIHMVLSVLAFSGLLFLLSYFGLGLFSDLKFKSILILSFALSFSSTVFVVKTLESKGEVNSFHGKIAIGILIIQDIFAVLFIALSDQKLPSIWFFTLPIILFGLKKLLGYTLNLLEHGEMIAVFGFFATFIAGAFSFSLLGLKADLGALVMGMLLVNHPRSDELYNRMSEYKDFFLIAFFINVGLLGLPYFGILWASLILLPFIFFKGGLFVWIFTKMPVRPRTNLLTSISLTNYSEFGLIVGVVAFQKDFFSEDWLIVMSLLMSFSFVIAAPLNVKATSLFRRLKPLILKLNNQEECIDTEPKLLGDATQVLIGLGFIGKSALERLIQKDKIDVIALDYSHDKVSEYLSKGYNAKWADTTDSEFWENVDLGKVKRIFITMSDFTSNVNTLKEIQKLPVKNFEVYAVSHYDDQIPRLKELGVDKIYHYKDNLGVDFVDFVCEEQ
jgi:predicted Kef-type K+ transport protein